MIPLLLGILFGFLALLHIYWALGGTLGFEKSIPVQPDGNPLFRPGPAVTLLVAAILLMIAAYFLGGWALMHDFRNLWSVPGWMIGIAFLLRSMGEFKYVGCVSAAWQNMQSSCRYSTAGIVTNTSQPYLCH